MRGAVSLIDSRKDILAKEVTVIFLLVAHFININIVLFPKVYLLFILYFSPSYAHYLCFPFVGILLELYCTLFTPKE